MPPQIQALNAKLPYLRMMVAAKSGFGKTVFSGTAKDALFLTTDPEGTASARAFGSTAKEWQINDYDELDRAVTWVRKEGPDHFKFIVVDNLTECQLMARQANIDAAIARREAKGSARNKLIPEQSDYLFAQLAVVDVVKKLISVPMHIIFTAHLKGLEDPEGNDFYSVAIQGSDGEVAERLLGYMNVIGMGEVVEKDDKEVRRLYFTHWGPFRGKDRYVKLGRYQDGLTVPKMMDIITTTTTTTTTPPRRIVARRRTPNAQADS